MPRKVYRAKYSGRIYNTREEAIRDNQSWLNAKKLQSQVDNIPYTYIGGKTRKETWDKYWDSDPVMKHATDSVAARYGISPKSLRNRLNNEGFTEAVIKHNNALIQNNPTSLFLDRGYSLLNAKNAYNGFKHFGLDDMYDYINNGTVKLINENWNDEWNKNEQGRRVHSANGLTVADNIGITAAALKGFKNIASKDFPGTSDYDLDRYSNAYFNRGMGGGRSWVKRGANGYEFKNGGLIRRRLSNGGYLSE